MSLLPFHPSPDVSSMPRIPTTRSHTNHFVRALVLRRAAQITKRTRPMKASSPNRAWRWKPAASQNDPSENIIVLRVMGFWYLSFILADFSRKFYILFLLSIIKQALFLTMAETA